MAFAHLSLSGSGWPDSVEEHTFAPLSKHNQGSVAHGLFHLWRACRFSAGLSFPRRFRFETMGTAVPFGETRHSRISRSHLSPRFRNGLALRRCWGDELLIG